MEAAIVEINKGRVEGEDQVYDFILGFCETPYPHITMDYCFLHGGFDSVGFAGRSPDSLIVLLNSEGYPVPFILQLWANQAQVVTEKMLSGSSDMTVDGLRSYYTEYSEAQIESFVREGMSEIFHDASVSLALYNYWGIKTADALNACLDEYLKNL